MIWFKHYYLVSISAVIYTIIVYPLVNDLFCKYIFTDWYYICTMIYQTMINGGMAAHLNFANERVAD